jgi:hypothetical protein
MKMNQLMEDAIVFSLPGYEVTRNVSVVVLPAPGLPYLRDNLNRLLVVFSNVARGPVKYIRDSARVLRYEEVTAREYSRAAHPAIQELIDEYLSFFPPQKGVVYEEPQVYQRDILMRLMAILLRVPDIPLGEQRIPSLDTWSAHREYCMLHGRDPYTARGRVMTNHSICSTRWIAGSDFVRTWVATVDVPEKYDWLMEPVVLRGGYTVIHYTRQDIGEIETLLRVFHNGVARRIQMWWRRWILNPRHPRAAVRLIRRMLRSGCITREEAREALRQHLESLKEITQ